MVNAEHLEKKLMNIVRGRKERVKRKIKKNRWMRFGGTNTNPKWKNQTTGEIVEIGDEGKGIIDIGEGGRLVTKNVKLTAFFVLMKRQGENYKRSSSLFKTKTGAMAFAKRYMDTN